MRTQKDIIRKIIDQSDRHMTAEEVYEACQAQGVQTSVATVYRNLGKMAGEGSLKKIAIAGQPDRFDKSVKQHEHLVCERCGGITDICIDGLKELLESRAGVPIRSFDLFMNYLCPSCATGEEA